MGPHDLVVVICDTPDGPITSPPMPRIQAQFMLLLTVTKGTGLSNPRIIPYIKEPPNGR